MEDVFFFFSHLGFIYTYYLHIRMVYPNNIPTLHLQNYRILL